MIRSDARENRDRILEVARRALAVDGDTSLKQIAQQAGVGFGTLYRHYANREALVLAVYRRDVDRLVDSVPHRLAQTTPLEALRAWTMELVGHMRIKHGLGDALSPGGRQSITEQTYDPVIAAITDMLDAGKRDGSIRDDADAADVLLLIGALWRTAPGEEHRAHRMLDLILNGLRTQPQTRRRAVPIGRDDDARGVHRGPRAAG